MHHSAQRWDDGGGGTKLASNQLLHETGIFGAAGVQRRIRSGQSQMRKAYDVTQWLLDYALVRRKRTTSRVLRRAEVHERFTAFERKCVVATDVRSTALDKAGQWCIRDVLVVFLESLGTANERSD